jgi:hypothetical protein
MMRDYDWTGWSNWNSLAKIHAEGFSMIDEGAGAYAIATTKLKIPRVVGIDKRGLLYVGETNDVRSRIRAFYDSVERGHQTHMGGWQYNLVKFERCAPVESLRVRWLPTKTRREALEAQTKLLYGYASAHCELPPLNCSFSRELLRDFGFRLVRKGA